MCADRGTLGPRRAVLRATLHLRLHAVVHLLERYIADALRDSRIHIAPSQEKCNRLSSVCAGRSAASRLNLDRRESGGVLRRAQMQAEVETPGCEFIAQNAARSVVTAVEPA